MYELPHVLLRMVEREGSQKAIWEAADLDSGTISRAISGQKVPKKHAIQALCAAFPQDAAAIRAAHAHDVVIEARVKSTTTAATRTKAQLQLSPGRALAVQRTHELICRLTDQEARGLGDILGMLAAQPWTSIAKQIGALATVGIREAEATGFTPPVFDPTVTREARRPGQAGNG